MNENYPPIIKRGPYRRYLNDSLSIPESTLRYCRLAARKRTAEEIEEVSL